MGWQERFSLWGKAKSSGNAGRRALGTGTLKEKLDTEVALALDCNYVALAPLAFLVALAPSPAPAGCRRHCTAIWSDLLCASRCRHFMFIVCYEAGQRNNLFSKPRRVLHARFLRSQTEPETARGFSWALGLSSGTRSNAVHMSV